MVRYEVIQGHPAAHGAGRVDAGHHPGALYGSVRIGVPRLASAAWFGRRIPHRRQGVAQRPSLAEQYRLQHL